MTKNVLRKLYCFYEISYKKQRSEMCKTKSKNIIKRKKEYKLCKNLFEQKLQN